MARITRPANSTAISADGPLRMSSTTSPVEIGPSGFRSEAALTPSRLAMCSTSLTMPSGMKIGVPAGKQTLTTLVMGSSTGSGPNVQGSADDAGSETTVVDGAAETPRKP